MMGKKNASDGDRRPVLTSETTKRKRFTYNQWLALRKAPELGQLKNEPVNILMNNVPNFALNQSYGSQTGVGNHFRVLTIKKEIGWLGEELGLEFS